MCEKHILLVKKYIIIRLIFFSNHNFSRFDIYESFLLYEKMACTWQFVILCMFSLVCNPDKIVYGIKPCDSLQRPSAGEDTRFTGDCVAHTLWKAYWDLNVAEK